jgi:hypothetical protein
LPTSKGAPQTPIKKIGVITTTGKAGKRPKRDIDILGRRSAVKEKTYFRFSKSEVAHKDLGELSS